MSTNYIELKEENKRIDEILTELGMEYYNARQTNDCGNNINTRKIEHRIDLLQQRKESNQLLIESYEKEANAKRS